MKRLRVIRLFLCVMAFAAALPLVADTETVGGYTWTYQINGATAKIYYPYHGSHVAISPVPTGPLTIPTMLGGYPVTGIGASAFRGCDGLTSVTIPDSVTSIENVAFAECSGLTSVIMPNGIMSIGEDAFAGCSGLTCITIPDSVTHIGGGAFSGCGCLTSVTIPQCVLDKGLSSVFSSSYQKIKNVVILDSATSIGDYVFQSCSGLTSVTIPYGVKNIGNRAFEYCSGLTNVTIPNSVTNIGEDAFCYCNGLTSITIPDSVTSIGSYAFYYCSGLTRVTIPQAVVNSFRTVFNGDMAVIVSPGVTSIGKSAFSDCSGLTSVVIPDSVTSIGDYAFKDCRTLTSMIIPSSVTSIGKSTFFGCSGLTTVTIPDGVTHIRDEAFSGCGGVTNITIPDRITSIGRYAFSDCHKLTDVTIPSNVTSIGSYAFNGCSGLTNLLFLGNAPSVGSYAFSDVAADCCAYVYRTSTGWDVEIPGTWQEIRIDYINRSIVTFDANGGTGGTSVEQDCGTAIVAPIVSRTGHTFIRWLPEVDATVPASNVIYTAQWRKNQYTVTFDANGGDGGTVVCIDYGTPIVAPTVTRPGYTFVRWLPEVDATVPASNVTYKAQWQCLTEPCVGIVYAYPFRRNVDFAHESDFFGYAIPATVIFNGDAQPLLGEWFGIQVQVATSGMADIDLESIEVHMAWFASEYPWGWETWKDNANVKDIVLERAADWSADNLVYRSNPTVQESFVPPQVPSENGCRVVQYQVWIEFKDNKGNSQGIRYLGASDWMLPAWYRPLDLSKAHGTFSAYTILDEISPKRVWINEVNMYQYGNLNDAAHQYIEIAAPMGYDLTGWSVSAVQANNSWHSLNTLFTMGDNGVSPRKITPSVGNYVFYAIQSPQTKAAGTYGALDDGVWRRDAFESYDGKENIGYPCALRLCRPNGIIEHEIVFMCTNQYAGSRYAYLYDGTNFLKEVNENVQPGDVNLWFYAGADDQGNVSDDYSLGVYTGHGEESTWTNMMVQTPGAANRLTNGSQQFIDLDYYKPPATRILWIYASIASGNSDTMSMVVDGVTNKSTVITSPQNFDGTFTSSINFLVKDGFEIDNVTTNGGIVAEASGKTGTWTLNLNLSNLNSYRLYVDASARPVGSGSDFIPAVSTDAVPEVVVAALSGSADVNLTANITNATQYTDYRTWALSVTNETITAQTVKESIRAWLSYALGADALIGKEITSNDVQIVGFEVGDGGAMGTSGAMGSSRPTFTFEVAIDGVNIGGGTVSETMLKENLKKVLGIEGAKSLSSGAFSSDNIDITFDTPVDGKAKFTVSPPADAGNSFFMRVKVK